MGIYLGPFRITKRGVRARVGPRIMRVHVGSGGAGISTGAGPFTYYKRIGGKKRPARRSGAARPRTTQPPPYRQNVPPAIPAATQQLPQPQPRRPLGWPGWLLAVAIAGLVAGFSLAAVGGSNTKDAAATASGAITSLALIALCVAVPAALYRRHRSRRLAQGPQLPGTSPSLCYRCGQPLEAHVSYGNQLACPARHA